MNTVGCRGLAKTLFDITSWDEEARYRFQGQYVEKGEEKLLLFEMKEPVTIKTITETVIPEMPDEENKEEIVSKKTVTIYPESWLTTFGDAVSVTSASVFEQIRYSDEWDILRPATEFEERNILSVERLSALMREAEGIMERWTNTHE